MVPSPYPNRNRPSFCLLLLIGQTSLPCWGYVAGFWQSTSRLDSLVDLVTSGVGPAVLLISVSDFSAWSYPGALAIILAGVLRLAYFDVFGVDENGAYAGVTIDNSPIVLSAIFLLQSFLSHNSFVAVLYGAILVMALLHVAPFRTGKLGRVWNYIFSAYVVLMTGVYSFILWT